MKDKNIFILKQIHLLVIILLYYIVGLKEMFLYVLSYSLYQILSSFFHNFSLKEWLSKNIASKELYKHTVLSIIIISMLFTFISIIVSDIISSVFNINNILLIFLFMGISIMIEPLVKLTSEYLIHVSNNSKYQKFVDIYYISNYILMIIIALLFFRIFNIQENIAVSLLYLSKIISGIIILTFMYLINKNIHNENNKNNNISYKVIKEIYLKNNYKNIIEIVKNSYYYISIIILYLVLSSRFGYATDEISSIITFVYFYAISIMEYLIYIVEYIDDKITNKRTIIDIIYNNFRVMLTAMIFLSIVSPLICRLLFNNANYSVYLTMINIMTIFVLLYDIIYKNIKKKLIIYIGLFVGIISKLILIIPLINAFYRMGYSLVYGDILSSVIGMILSISIGYIYISNTTKKEKKYFEKILDILFDNILICIILIIVQFIVPIETNNYFKTLGILIIYIICLYVALKVILVKLRKMRRG